MSDTKTFLALFEDIGPAAEAIDQLREMGIQDDEMNVIAGIPVTERMLGRPHQWTNVPRLAMGGAIAGLLVGLFFSFGAPYLYPLQVGGQPLSPGAPTVVVLFEMTMLGLMVSTFLGVFLDSYFPSYRPKEYVPEISEGKIAVLFNVHQDHLETFTEALTKLGAESVMPAEARTL